MCKMGQINLDQEESSQQLEIVVGEKDDAIVQMENIVNSIVEADY